MWLKFADAAAAVIRCQVFISQFHPRAGETNPTRCVNYVSSRHAHQDPIWTSVELFVPGIELQAALHNAHRYILQALYPMPLFESQAVATVHRYSHAVLYFPGNLAGLIRLQLCCQLYCIFRA